MDVAVVPVVVVLVPVIEEVVPSVFVVVLVVLDESDPSFAPQTPFCTAGPRLDFK